MIKLIDISFFANTEFAGGIDAINAFKPAFGYIDFIKGRLDIQVIKHAGREETLIYQGVQFSFFKGRNRLWHIPFKTFSYVKKQEPGIVIVQGIGFPLQVLMLRFTLGRSCAIIVQHHAERPLRGIKKTLQKMADKCIDAYLFTTGKNAEEWYDEGIIDNAAKYNELLELSTYFSRLDKKQSRKKLGMGDNDIFLWVGRLEANKDPITVLKGFEKYVSSRPSAILYMVYQEDQLLPEVKKMMTESIFLNRSVRLIGKIERDELPAWFSAADFYLSGSHREGSGTALIEAMACGCIPVVTNIPSFSSITAGGQHGILYTPGDAESLSGALKALDKIDKENFSANVVSHFEKKLSFKAIADDLYEICMKIRNGRKLSHAADEVAGTSL